jgi:hypothetical protein
METNAKQDYQEPTLVREGDFAELTECTRGGSNWEWIPDGWGN